jgi:adenylate kinase
MVGAVHGHDVTRAGLLPVGVGHARDGDRVEAEALARALDERGRRLTAALLVDADDDVVVERLSGRRQCEDGHLYHMVFDPPARDEVCDHDGKPLFRRPDDEPETIRRRLAAYHEQTEPLIDFYDERGLLRRFDGARDKTEVHDHMRAALATLRLEEQL